MPVNSKSRHDSTSTKVGNEGGDAVAKSSVLDDLAARFEGEKNTANRFEGAGKYTYEHGRYEGNFFDGKWHGDGILYLKGGHYVGKWKEGVMQTGTFVFESDDMEKDTAEANWTYCTSADPRFFREVSEGVPVGGPLKHLICHKKEVRLPSKCYDVVDGYFDPKKGTVCSYETGSELRKPNAKEIDWITKNCRVSQ